MVLCIRCIAGQEEVALTDDVTTFGGALSEDQADLEHFPCKAWEPYDVVWFINWPDGYLVEMMKSYNSSEPCNISKVFELEVSMHDAQSRFDHKPDDLQMPLAWSSLTTKSLVLADLVVPQAKVWM